tara:strand:+ start:239 stop:517 length:279 start_codon:yes stop_codon:yes gene_type:complete
VSEPAISPHAPVVFVRLADELLSVGRGNGPTLRLKLLASRRILRVPKPVKVEILQFDVLSTLMKFGLKSTTKNGQISGQLFESKQSFFFIFQ